MDRLQAMRVLVAVLDHRSLSAAAVSLRMSLPTVSRTLARLERELGVRLIARTTRGVAETDGGRLYYRHCQKILAEIDEADSAVQTHAHAPVGELRVTAPVTFGRYRVLRRRHSAARSETPADRFALAVATFPLETPVAFPIVSGCIQVRVLGQGDRQARAPQRMKCSLALPTVTGVSEKRMGWHVDRLA